MPARVGIVLFHLQQEPAWNGIELMNGVKYVRPGGGFVPNFPLTLKSDANGANEHKLYTHLKVNLSLLYSGSSSRNCKPHAGIKIWRF